MDRSNKANKDQSRIDKINDSLYSRNAPDVRSRRKTKFNSPDVEVNTDWEHENIDTEDVRLNEEYKDRSMSFFTKIFIGSLVFFIFTLGIGALLVFKGSNIVSANNVDILINGPTSVSGGEPVSFDLQVSNQNNIKLESIYMTIDFPVDTTSAENQQKELRNIKDTIEDIPPGGIGKKTIEAVLYGEENEKKQIKVSVEYKVKGSSSIFRKEKTFDIIISSSPVSLSVSSFKEVNSGQEFEMEVIVSSNSEEVIKNLLLKANYPFGFNYLSADTRPLSDNTLWKIGDIPPGGKKKIKISGKIDGQDDEVRVFRFSLGAQSLVDDARIGTEYISSSQEVSIKRPFMTLGISLDGEYSSEDYVTSFNSPVKVEVSYFNNLQTSITNAEITAEISGTAFDKVSVSPDRGLYKSENGEIVWNGVTNSELREVGAGESGKLTFTLVPRDLNSQSGTATKNPEINIAVGVKGRRVAESNVPEKISGTIDRNIKVSSKLTLGGQVLRSIGPFENTGFVPPKAEQQTTYTVVWTVDNTSNSVSSARVRSSLPSYVKWLGKISPSSENITYDSSDGQIVWNIGNVSTYTAGTSKRRQVVFQIGLNPNITQVGQIPILVSESSLSAEDDFTGETLKSSIGVLNTRFSSDPSFREGDEKVVQ